MEYGKLPQQPVAPLNPLQMSAVSTSMLTARLRIGTPHINTFSGDATPRKTEVSFKQWYHEVQCVKDPYPETVVRESIIHLLKESTTDIVWYMGPTTSINHILWKLLVIFGTVASFALLMQNVYKMSEGNNNKATVATEPAEGVAKLTQQIAWANGFPDPGRIGQWQHHYCE